MTTTARMTRSSLRTRTATRTFSCGTASNTRAHRSRYLPGPSCRA
jgi:hypothetical protein